MSWDIYLLHVDLDVLLQGIPVEIEHEVVDKIESIADDYERQLVGKFGLFQEVLHAFRVVAVALAAYALHLFDLARFAGRLDVLEVDLVVLAEVHYGAQEVEEACKKLCNFLGKKNNFF